LDVPSFPTDNLYKFVALAGLAGCFVLPNYYLSTVSDLERQMVEASVEMRVLLEEFSDLKKEQRRLGVAIKDVRRRQRPIHGRLKELAREATLANVRRARNELEAMLAEIKDQVEAAGKANSETVATLERLNEKRLELMKARYRLEGQHALTGLLVDRLHSFRQTFIGLLTFSIVLAIMGFWFWYSRVQVYQDRIARQQAEGTQRTSDSD